MNIRFKLHAEYVCPADENSGIYLRGRYEAQVAPAPDPARQAAAAKPKRKMDEATKAKIAANRAAYVAELKAKRAEQERQQAAAFHEMAKQVIAADNPEAHLLQLATPSSRNLLIPHEGMPSTQKS